MHIDPRAGRAAPHAGSVAAGCPPRTCHKPARNVASTTVYTEAMQEHLKQLRRTLQRRPPEPDGPLLQAAQHVHILMLGRPLARPCLHAHACRSCRQPARCTSAVPHQMQGWPSAVRSTWPRCCPGRLSRRLCRTASPLPTRHACQHGPHPQPIYLPHNGASDDHGMQTCLMSEEQVACRKGSLHTWSHNGERSSHGYRSTTSRMPPAFRVVAKCSGASSSWRSRPTPSGRPGDHAAGRMHA
jgi:hypothetical protein